MFTVSLTVPVGHLFVHALYAVIAVSIMYPVAHEEQFLARDAHPEQLTSHGEHLFKVVSANVPNGQLVEATQVFVTVLRKVVEGQDVHIIESP